MSVATAVVSVPDINSTTFRAPWFEAIGTVAIDAGPATYAAGGLVMSLAHPLIKAQRAPKRVTVTGKAGFIYKYIAGTDNTNGKLMVFEQSGVDDAPLDEYDDTVAISAALSGDTINFKAEFLGML